MVVGAHGVADELRPEFRVSVPSNPVNSPSVFEVAGESDDLSEAVSRSGENRFIVFGDEKCFGVGFEFGFDVSEKERGGIP